MADPGEGSGGAGPPLIFRPNGGPKSQKFWGGDRPPFLSKGLDDRAPHLSQGLDPAMTSYIFISVSFYFSFVFGYGNVSK